MQIQIPDDLSTRLKQLAARRRQPVEEIITDRLFTALDDELDNLPSAEEAELRALHHLSDDALRAIAAEQMSTENQALLAELMERNDRGSLTTDEQATLTGLVERGDQLMLRKAEAAVILVHRGYKGSAADLMHAGV
jgi:predicted transcriptional regulator